MTIGLTRRKWSSGLPSPAKNARTAAIFAAVGSVVDGDEVEDPVAFVDVVLLLGPLPLEHAASRHTRHVAPARRAMGIRGVERAFFACITRSYRPPRRAHRH
jgi:hypothetical protein